MPDRLGNREFRKKVTKKIEAVDPSEVDQNGRVTDDSHSSSFPVGEDSESFPKA